MRNLYDNTEIIKNQSGKLQYTSILFPDIPLNDLDYYVTTTEGDRLDKLAKDFYKDESLWKIIKLANPNTIKNFSIYPPLGVQIRIPYISEEFKAKLKEINS